MSARKLALCFVAAASVAACTDSPAMTKPRHVPRDAGADAATPVLEYWVGAVDDSDIRLGVAAQGTRARLFFCGGPSSFATATRWVVVELAADGGFELKDGDWHLEGTFGDKQLQGKLRAGTESAVQSFSARPKSDDTIAGLYEGTADCGRVGLIVTQPTRTDEVTGQGACVGMGHPPEQVNPILPIELRDEAIQVEVGGQQTGLQPAAAPLVL